MTQPIRCRFLIGALALVAAGAAGAQVTTSTASSPAKKELVQRFLKVQQNDIEGAARSLVEQPAAAMMREAGLAMQQQQMPAEKFQQLGKQIEAEVKKYVDEAYPLVRDKALKIAPTTIGAALEAKMTEDELKQLLAWLESPAAKKFQQVAAESRNEFLQQIRSEAGPLVQPKLVALDGRIRVILGVPPAGGQPSAAPTPTPAPSAKPPARPASK
jgi:uncharacterized protein